MKLVIDTEKGIVDTGEDEFALYSKVSFEMLSDIWLKVGWSLKYTYTFSWLGVPIIQLPEDMFRIQEVIFRLKPDVIIETGVAHGGSLIFYASLCKLLGHGQVIGIEKDFRHWDDLKSHPLFEYITLVEGDSVSAETLAKVGYLSQGKRALVILDSNHSKRHVFAELEAYRSFVEKGSYLVACDGNMKDLYDVPRGSPEWKWNNPHEAAQDFANKYPEFVIEPPAWTFNESPLTKDITYWPSAWLRRV